jgi:hypothetical protein
VKLIIQGNTVDIENIKGGRAEAVLYLQRSYGYRQLLINQISRGASLKEQSHQIGFM